MFSVVHTLASGVSTAAAGRACWSEASTSGALSSADSDTPRLGAADVRSTVGCGRATTLLARHTPLTAMPGAAASGASTTDSGSCSWTALLSTSTPSASNAGTRAVLIADNCRCSTGSSIIGACTMNSGTATTVASMTAPVSEGPSTSGSVAAMCTDASTSGGSLTIASSRDGSPTGSTNDIGTGAATGCSTTSSTRGKVRLAEAAVSGVETCGSSTRS